MEEFKNYQRQKGFAENSIRANKNTILQFEQWLKSESFSLDTVGYNELMLFVSHCKNKGNKSNTVRMKVKSLSHYFDFLNQTSTTIKDNPATLVKLKGQTRNIPHNLFEKQELLEIYALQHTKGLVGKRDKVLLSLVVFQGVGSTELEKIELKDLDLQNASVYVPSTRNTNSRTLELKPIQLLLFQDYVTQTRREIIKETGRQSDKLLVSLGMGTKETLHNVIARILQQIKPRYLKLKGMQQIRQSVITAWIAEQGLRQAQYMAGHRFVSSTERYNVERLDGLKSEIEQHFPRISS